MKAFKKIILVFAILLVAVTLLVFVYNRLPHRSTDVEQLHSDFSDIPIESCEYYVKSDVIFMGGVLEYHSYGKINVSKEYYENLLKTYDFREASGMVDYQMMSSKKLVGEFKDFITNETYLISDEFQEDFYPFVCLSPNEYALYYYFYTF